MMSVEPPAGLPPDFESSLDDVGVRHCYRHPDRETGVSCSNCGRPICHECMITAPVGFWCPECVREANHRGSRARVVTRGQTRSRWERGALGGSGAPVTRILIILNVLAFLVELATGASGLMGGGSTRALLDMGALVPAYVVVRHEYWRLAASMFLHLGFIHILFNMWALYVVGSYVEAILGRAKYLVLYLLSGLAGSVLVLLAAPLFTPTVGASGAIFGLFGALAVHAFLNRGRDLQSRALLGNIVFLLVINLVFSFTASFVSWQAHVGGLVGGAVAMLAFMRAGRRDPRRPWDAADVLTVVVLVAALAGLAWWRVTTATVL